MSERTFTPKIGDGFVFVDSAGNSFPARIICVDAKNPRLPIAALVFRAHDIETLWPATSDGEIYRTVRLYDAPKIEDRWVNVYCNDDAYVYRAREKAEAGRVVDTDGTIASNYIGLLHFQIIDGVPSNPEFVA